MFENFTSSQKAVGGGVVIAGIVGWIFAFVQIGEVTSLKNEIGPALQILASANDNLVQLQGDLDEAQSDRNQLQQQVDAAATLLARNPEIARALITHRMPLEAAPEAFEIAAQRSNGAIKVVLEPAAK